MTKIRLDVSTKLTIVQAVGGGWIKRGPLLKGQRQKVTKVIVSSALGASAQHAD